MSATPACLCGSQEAELVQEGVRHDERATVWRYSTCDLVYTWLRPTAGELATYYAEVYRGEYGAVTPDALRRMGAADTEARVARLDALLRGDAHVLDVGAGSGSFADAVRSRVASVAAVEPDEPTRASIATDLGIPAVAALADLPADAAFDLVTVFHVLEHVPDPPAFLRGLAGLLRPDGVVAVEVPNIDDALVSVYPGTAYRPFYFQKAHLFYFSATTLARTAADAGLAGTVEHVQRYGLRNHLHWLAAGGPGGDAHYREVVDDEADAAYRASLVRSGSSDTLWLLANTTGIASASATNP